MMNSFIQTKAVFTTAFIFLLLLADQALKLWVKTTFRLGEDHEIFSWFHLLFVENNGMAFGMEIGRKFFLTLFRILASGLLVWYLVRCIRRNRAWLTLVCLAMILAGAVGNIIDCVFYGVWFDYAGWFNGRVVDMLYFPLIHGTFWNWLPWVGGEDFIFFSPVFNFADACITTGVFLILIFDRHIFDSEPQEAAASVHERP